MLYEKKDGSMRFAIDYRLLNDVTKKGAYPIPDIQEILDKLEGSDHYIILPGHGFRLLVCADARARHRAFSTHRGQFEMLVMPFGLCNAQGTFQRIMD